MGDVIQVEVTYDENVDVTGTPFLTLMVGTTERQALYAGGTGSNKLVFRYTVKSSETDTDRLVVKASSLALNSGDKISDKAGNAALLTHTAAYAVAPALVTDASQRRVNAAKLREGVPLTTGPVRVTDDVVLQAPVPVGAAVGSDFTLTSSERGITTVVIDGSTYALVPAYGDDVVQIIDISDPSAPQAVAEIEDDADGFTELESPIDITTVVIDGRTYALVAAYDDDGVQIIDISDPSDPRAVAALEDGKGGFTALYGAYGVTTAVIGGKTYALVAARGNYDGDYDGVQIIDISDPSTPRAVAALEDDADGFTMLGRAFAITTAVVGGKTYALVAANDDSGVQIIDISNPSGPKAVVALEDDKGGFTMLASPTDITTVVIDGRTYALVAASADNGVQIIDISNPSSPKAVAALEDGVGGFDSLELAWGITTVVIGDRTYALVAAYNDAGVQIIDISDPSGPKAVAALEDGKGGFDSLGGADGITTVTVEGRVYALVAAYDDDAVQIIELPIQPSIASIEIKTRGLGAAHEQLRYGAGLDDFLAIGGGANTEKTGVTIAGIDGLELAWSASDNSITIRKADSNALTTVQTEAIIAALRYTHGDADNAGEGERVFTFVLRDTAGNETASARQVGVSVVVDRTAPGVLRVTWPTDTGSSSSDGITNANRVTISTPEAGASWEYSTDSGQNWMGGTDTSFTLPDGTYIEDAIWVRQRDAADNPSAVSKNPTGITVDATAPSVTSTAITSTSPYKAGDVIQVTVTYDENVEVTGTPFLTLMVGTTEREALYAGGTGSDKLVFRYTVQSGETDTDRLVVKASSLALNSGDKISDKAGNAALLTHTAVYAVAPALVTDASQRKVNAAKLREGVSLTTGPVRVTDDVVLQAPKAAAAAVDGSDFRLRSSEIGITTVVIGHSTYALVPAYDDDAVQIIDISDPSDPQAVVALEDDKGGFDRLGGAIDITTVVIDGKTYALVAAGNDDGVQIIDISTPSSPRAVVALEDGKGGFTALYSANGVTTAVIGGKTYALVAARGDYDGDNDGVQIIDISDPSGPRAVAALEDDAGDFTMLGGAFAITTTVIGGKTYALVAANDDSGVQIIDISTPSSPRAVVALEDDAGGFTMLGGATDITTAVIGGKTYALVVASTDNGVQIIDISDPSDPKAVAALEDGKGGFDMLDRAWGITTVVIGDSTYALVAAYGDGGVQIIDISDPSTPQAVAALADGVDSFDSLGGAAGVTTVTVEGRVYALVAAYDDNAVQIIELPIQPSIASIEIKTRGLGTAHEQLRYGAGLDDFLAIGGQAATEKTGVAIAGIDGLELAWSVSDNSITIRKADNNALLTIQTEAIIAALRYAHGDADNAGEGERVFTFVLRDTAGNETASARQVGVSVVVDKTPPAAPTLELNEDTGDSTSDGVTSNGAFTVGGVESGASWEYSTDSGNSWTNGSGNSFTLSDRVYAIDAIHVRQRDAADNPSAVSKNPTEITVDTRAPSALTMSLPTDTGKSSSDGLTKENRVTISGKESGASWEYSTDSGQNWTPGSVTSFTLSDGTYTKDMIHVRQTDAAGNTSTVSKNPTGRTVDTLAPSVTNTEITSAGPYKAGAVIEVKVTYDEDVDVTGTPYLTLEVGSTNRQAEYQSGTGSTELVFRYTVGARETDANGVVVKASSLDLNSGTIQDGAGNAASLTNQAVGVADDQKVDTTAPRVTRTAITSSGPYKAGAAIDVTVTYNEAVEVDTKSGTPYLTLVVGTTNQRAAYHSGKGSTDLVFRYTVQSGETDTNGVVVTANSLTLNGGKISDVAGNAASRTNLAVIAANAQKVDTTAPASLTVSWPTDTGSSNKDGITNANTVTISTPESGASWEYSTDSGNKWKTGSSTSFTLLDGVYTINAIQVRQRDAADNPSVVIGNTKQITVDTRAPSALTMTLPTDVGKSSSDGITKEDSVTVGGVESGATWEYSTDSGQSWTTGTATSFTLPDGDYVKDAIRVRQTDAAGNTSTVRTNTPVITVDTTAPSVTNTEITSRGPYKAGDVIEVTVTYDEAVEVVTTNGRPSLTLKVGSNDRQALYVRGKGSTELVFQYTVGSSDTDANGVVVTASSLTLNRGTLQDVAGNAASRTNLAVIAANAQKVDTTAPAPLTVSWPRDTGRSSSDGITNVNTVTISTPESGASWEYSTDSGNSWTTGSSTSFILPDRVYAIDAIRVRQRDAADNPSAVSKNAKGITVDTRAPSALTMTLPTDVGKSSSDGITKEDSVTVGGVESGATWEYSTDSGQSWTTGTATSFTLPDGDYVKDAIRVRQTDAAGNTSTVRTNTPVITVDTTAPSVTNTEITSRGPYKAGDVIEVTVTYDEAVEVVTTNGRPSLTLKVGSNDRQALYVRGKGSTELVFQYTVGSSDTDANGVVVTASSLTLNRGTLQDVAGNAASRTNLAVSADNDQKVDTTAPAPLTVSWPTDTGSSSSDGITNVNTVTISTPETGANWEYSTDSGNSWTTGSSTSFILPDRVYAIDAIRVRQRDAADNPSAVSKNAKGITVDTRAPSALTMTLPTDVGKSSSDGITKEDSVTVGGVEDDASWEYSSDSGNSWTDGGTGTSFTLPDGDYVKDAIRVRQTDAAGNTSTVRTNTPVITVDTTAPSVTNTEITSRGPYKAGDVIEVTVTYDEAVEVVTTNGRPSLTLKVGTTDRQALYVRGTGSTELVFQYTVGSSDTDANGVVVTASSLTLNRGTLQDVAGNAASRTNLAVSADNDQKVDTTAPAPLTVSWPTDTGSSTSDGITNVNTVTISTPETGANWEYSTDSGNSWTTGSSTSFILPDRVYAIDAIRVRQRDAADNPSAVSKNAKGITVDTRAPSALTMTLPTDVGKSSSDGITKEDSVTVGGVESGATWEYSTDSGQSWTTGTATSFTLPDGDYVKDAIRVRQTDAAGNTSTVRTNTPVITVDTTAPSVTNTEITSRGPYKAGDVIEVTVTYDEAVEVVTTNGRPSLTLKVGTTDRQALYVRGTGSTELVFQYTVGSSDTDANGVVVTASSLTLNRGTLQDVAGNAASRTNLAVIAANAQKVDTTAPAPLTVSWPRDTGRSSSDGITNVNTVTISTPESGASWEYSTDSGNSWTTGSSTSFILPDRVYAIDAIRVRQRDAADNPSAVSKNAKGITVDTRAPSALTMTLPTDVGKSSSDGITKEDSVTVGGVESGATWEYSTDSGQSWTTGTATSFTLPDGDYVKDAIRVRQTDAAGNTSTVRTNTPVITVDTTAPSVTNTEITSRGPYKAGDVIEVTVTYDEAVEVVTTNGRPSLTLKVGSTDRQALYVRGKGSTELVFQYTVGSSDTDANGVVVTASSLTLNRGTLQDVAGNAASRTNLAVIAANAQKVDTTAPAPLTVSWPRDTGRSSSDGITNVNTVTISTPESGASWEYSTDSGNSWTTGSSTSFILPDRVYAIDAIRVRQRDAADNPSAVSKNAKGITVDTRAPSALTMTLPTDVGKSSSDGITKEDSVTVGGVESGATWEYSTDSGQSWTTGTATSFTLPDGDYVKDAIRVRQTDAAGNTSTVRTNTPVITVDTTAPSVTNTEITSRGPYKAGDVIEVTVTYDEAVEVVTTNGRPSLTLKVGSNDRQALYVRGKGSTELVFQYTVGSSDTDANGVVVTASSLTLNRGTLQDVAGNAASRTNLAVIAANAQKVDTTAPAPLTVSWPRDTGRSSSDGITNVNTVTISTPESGASWEYSTDSGNSWTTGSSTSFILPDRVYAIDAIRVRQRDAADNPSAVSKNAKGITVDTRAPSALTMTLPTDVGKSSSDGITKEDSVTVGGVESGATWEYSTDSGQSWKNGSSTSFTLPDGTYTKDMIHVRQTDAAGNTSTVSKNPTGRTVDTSAPSVTNTAITSSGPYKAGAAIDVTVTYNEAVEVDTKSGTPYLTLVVGSTNQRAAYHSGKGSTDLVFRYTVQSGETDANGVVVTANSLTLNGGKISDVAGNAASRTNLAVIAANAQKVDTTAPASLTVSWPTDTGSSNKDGITKLNTVTISTPESRASWEYSTDSGQNWTTGSGNSFTLPDRVYAIDAIRVRQRDAADNPSTVSKNPTEITVDTRAPSALTMSLPTDTGSSSSDGITKENRVTIAGQESGASWEYSTDSGRSWKNGSSTSFTLPDGTYTKDMIHVRQTDAAGNTSTVSKNPTGRTVDTSAPSVTNTAITSSGPYKAGAAIDVTVTYNEAVEVDTKSGTPYLTLVVGSTNQRAAYHSGKGSTDLVFRYTVQSGETDANGVVVTANSLTLNGGKISDVAGNAASRTNLAVIAANAQKVDTTAPASLTVSWPTDTGSSSSDGITNANRVTISTPESGATWQYSTDGGQRWTTGSGTDFTLTDGVYAINTIQVRQTDAVSNTSSVSKNATGITVDTRAPVALTMTLPTDTGKSSSDGLTKENRVTISTPEVGASWEYSSDSGTSWTDGGSGSSFTLAEGSYVKDAIRVRQTDAAGNTSVVSKHPTEITVDTRAPSVTNTAITSSGPYKAGAVIEVTVTYDEDVEVVTTSGTPSLTLEVGTNDRQALYARGTGSTELVFRYTVGVSDTDTNGVAVKASSLALNSGKISDVAGNDASLTNAAVSTASDQAVDTTAPAVLMVTWPSDTGSSSSDGLTNANRVTIRTPEAGATWEYSTNSGNSWTDGSGRGFTLSEGVYAINAIRVRQTDAVGNTSAVTGNTKEITVDTSAPSALTMTLPTDTGTSSGDGITKENRVVISTPEVGASWEYSVNGGKDWTAGTDTDFTLSEDSYAINAIQVRQTDEAGNRSLVSGNTTEITVDRAPPGVLTVTWPVDTGSSNSDGLTKENRVVISTPEAGASWEYSVNSGTDWTAGTDTGFTLSEGSYAINAIRVRQTDAAGNRSLVSGNAKALTVDTSAPVALTMTLPTDTGSSNSDGLTKENRVTISTPEAGASWEYSVNSGTDWAAGTDTGFILSEGSYAINEIQVRQTDAAGNRSLVSGNAAAVTVDRAAPVVTDTAITSTGPYKAGAVIEVTVTYDEDVEVDTTDGRPSLTLKVGTNDRQAEYHSGSDSTALVFRYQVVASDTDEDGASVTANSLSLNLGTIGDLAGNAASLGHGAVTAASDQKVDTTAPVALAMTLPLDTGSSSSDGLTKENRVTISTPEADAIWEYSVNSGKDWTTGTDTGFILSEGSYAIDAIRVRQTDAAGNRSPVSGNPTEITVDTSAPVALTMTLPVDTGSSSSDGLTNANRVTISTPEVGASWEYSVNGGKDWTSGTDTGFTLRDGTYAKDVIQVRQTDAAGNRSLVSGNAKAVTVDTSAPVALTMTLPTDTGSSNSDGLTKENRVTISTPEAGASWEYSVNSGTDWAAGTDTGFTLSEGVYAIDAIQVRQTDEAGNRSLLSKNPTEITVDTSAPDALTMILPVDTGSSSSDGLTKENRVTISTPEAGASWEYSVNGGKDWTSGTDTDFTLSDGTYAKDAIQVRQTDAAGNRSLVSGNAKEITVDTRAPVALTMTLPVDTGTSNSDGLTKENRVTISTPEAGASWEYSVNGGKDWTSGTDTDFTLSEGRYAIDAIQVRQTDAAGNRSLVSKNHKEVTVDTSAPVALTMTLPVDTGSSSSDGITKENRVTISTPEDDAIWEYSVNGGKDWTSGTDTGFTLSDGSYAKDAIQVRQTDAAGNRSLVSGNAKEITVDTRAPVALTMTLPVDTGSSSSDGLTKENRVIISTPEAEASWEYSVNSGKDWAAGSGRSFTLPEGSYAKDVIRVRQTDEAGNTSSGEWEYHGDHGGPGGAGGDKHFDHLEGSVQGGRCHRGDGDLR